MFRRLATCSIAVIQKLIGTCAPFARRATIGLCVIGLIPSVIKAATCVLPSKEPESVHRYTHWFNPRSVTSLPREFTACVGAIALASAVYSPAVVAGACVTASIIGCDHSIRRYRMYKELGAHYSAVDAAPTFLNGQHFVAPAMLDDVMRGTCSHSSRRRRRRLMAISSSIAHLIEARMPVSGRKRCTLSEHSVLRTAHLILNEMKTNVRLEQRDAIVKWAAECYWIGSLTTFETRAFSQDTAVRALRGALSGDE
jgi:hypothetical protein